MSETCSECKQDLATTDTVLCDSCGRAFHKKPCSGLNASEIKVMELKGQRQLRFFCRDCQQGLSHVPALIKAVDELKNQIDELKKKSPPSFPVPSSSATTDSSLSFQCERDMLTELQERQKRANHLMIFNLPEGNDLADANEVLKTLMDNPPSIVTSSRVGKANNNNARALKVVLDSPETVNRLVRNSYKLKGKKIYVNFDLTQKQRELDKNILNELKSRRDKGENVSLKYRNGTPFIVQKKN